MKYRFVAPPLLALLAACTSHPPERPVAPKSAEPAETRRRVVTRPAVRPSATARRTMESFDPARMATHVLAQVNAQRRRAGSRPLRPDPGLTRAAQRYARELATRRQIEHVSRTPGRRTFRQRIAAEGVRARIAGENLARLTASGRTLPARAVQAWMRSPGHRSNMLDRSYARTGIGVWLGADGVWYVVQEFATAD